jgi:regulator of protease activity HflC (stomatin/prohibitin superfamily)
MRPEELALVLTAARYLGYAVGAYVAWRVAYSIVSSVVRPFRMLVSVQTGTRAVVERFGRADRVLEPGVHWLTPFVESLHYVNWSCPVERRDDDGATYVVKERVRTPYVRVEETMLDLPAYEMPTKDRLLVDVNCVLFYRIDDVTKACYNIDNLLDSLAQLAETSMRNAIQRLTLEQSIGRLAAIQSDVFEALESIQEDWGVTVTRFQLQSIDPPQAVLRATEASVVARRKIDAERAKVEASRELEGVRRESKRQGDMAAAELKADMAAAAREAERARLADEARLEMERAKSMRKLDETQRENERLRKVAELELKHAVARAARDIEATRRENERLAKAGEAELAVEMAEGRKRKREVEATAEQADAEARVRVCRIETEADAARLRAANEADVAHSRALNDVALDHVRAANEAEVAKSVALYTATADGVRALCEAGGGPELLMERERSAVLCAALASAKAAVIPLESAQLWGARSVMPTVDMGAVD